LRRKKENSCTPGLEEKNLADQKSSLKSPTRSESEDNEIEGLNEGDAEALPPIYFASKK